MPAPTSLVCLSDTNVSLCSCQVPKTSSLDSSSPLPPRASAQDGLPIPPATRQSPPGSPALSTASTADGETSTSSPSVPHLPAPPLPKRTLDLLRTPPAREHEDQSSSYITASWGSPYLPSEQENLQSQHSSDSDNSEEDSPVHRLELATPFLRPAPRLVLSPIEQQASSLAAILVNRARRPGPARGLTEDWIRQHTAADENVEPRHWLSDGTDSEHSSLSGSNPGEEAAWLDDRDLRTPRAIPTRAASRPTSAHPRARSSTETLKQSAVDPLRHENRAPIMASVGSEPAPMGNSTSTPDHGSVTASGASPGIQATMNRQEPPRPVTPTKMETKKESAPTPRVKKRVPWRGKNIMVLLPKDDERGRNNKPVPLKEYEVANMFREWEELGYDIRGFDLHEPPEYSALPIEHYSRSRDEWPAVEDLRKEWNDRKFKVTLPDIDGKCLSFLRLQHSGG